MSLLEIGASGQYFCNIARQFQLASEIASVTIQAVEGIYDTGKPVPLTKRDFDLFWHRSYFTRMIDPISTLPCA